MPLEPPKSPETLWRLNIRVLRRCVPSTFINLRIFTKLRDASSNLVDDLQTAHNFLRFRVFDLSHKKHARAAAETQAVNFPTPSTRSGEALARVKTSLAESQSLVRRLTVKLSNENKKVKTPPSRTPVVRATYPAIHILISERDAIAVERDSLVAERDCLQGCLDTRGTHISQLNENIGAVTEELRQTRLRADLREDQLIHQHQLNNWQRTQFTECFFSQK